MSPFRPNPAAALNAPTAFGCHAEIHWRRVTDQRCWPKLELPHGVKPPYEI